VKRWARRLERTIVWAGVAGLMGFAVLYSAPLPAPPAALPLPETTVILDREGRVLYGATGPGDVQREFVALDDISSRLRQAVVATEDADFYEHPGVDPVAVARAAVTNLLGGEIRSGGSTITQQLARNLYFAPEDRSGADPSRKVREALLALRIERFLGKDEILEQYLNTAYFGNLAYGVEAASRVYFGKGARELDLAEAALLAGLLQAPSRYDPFTRFEAAKARQEIVLRRMVEEGYITPAEASAALAEPLTLNPAPFPIEAPHFVVWVLEQLPALAGEDAVARGGLRVTTSLDLDLQRAAQTAVVRRIGELEDRNVTNGAVVAIDPVTGHVLAMVGSADYFDEGIDGAVNAALAPRQPGSAIKPIVYAAALEAGFTPATPLLDVPTALPTRNGHPYAPNNYDATFHGVVPLREALASSYNVPAVRVLAAIGFERALETARRFGLSTFTDPSRLDLSMTLGGAEVHLLDLTAAYAGLAAGGVRVEPVAVLRVEDATGRLLYVAPDPSARPRARVVSPQTAYLISDILSDEEARAPGFGYGGPLTLDRPAAVKTGTTTNFRDNWTIGYTPDLVVGVWVGNADNTPMLGLSGIDGAAPVWRDVMILAHRGRPSRPFPVPEGIERAQVCLPSGLLPTPYCRRQRMEVFAAGTAPARPDDYYRPVRVCAATGLAESAVPCPGPVIERVYAFVPVEAIPWARAAGVPLPPLAPWSDGPPAAGQAGAAFSGEPALLRVAYPADATTLRISRELRREDQAVRIEAIASVPLHAVELYVDGTLILSLDRPPYRGSWRIIKGTHEIRARGVEPGGAEVWSPVVRVTVLPP
jgi:1A family penicillin-binding protein